MKNFSHSTSTPREKSWCCPWYGSSLLRIADGEQNDDAHYESKRNAPGTSTKFCFALFPCVCKIETILLVSLLPVALRPLANYPTHVCTSTAHNQCTVLTECNAHRNVEHGNWYAQLPEITISCHWECNWYEWFLGLCVAKPWFSRI